MQQRYAGKVAVVLAATDPHSMGGTIARRLHRRGREGHRRRTSARKVEPFAAEIGAVPAVCDITIEQDVAAVADTGNREVRQARRRRQLCGRGDHGLHRRHRRGHAAPGNRHSFHRSVLLHQAHGREDGEGWCDRHDLLDYCDADVSESRGLHGCQGRHRPPGPGRCIRVRRRRASRSIRCRRASPKAR